MAKTWSNDEDIIKNYQDTRCKCNSEHCYHKKTCDMVATPCNFKERYCQICRLDIYHDAQEAKNAEFLQRSAAAAKGENLWLQVGCFSRCHQCMSMYMSTHVKNSAQTTRMLKMLVQNG